MYFANTLKASLEVFPIAIPRTSKKRKCNTIEPPESLDDLTQQISRGSQHSWKSILSPSPDEKLGDAMNRIQLTLPTAKRRRTNTDLRERLDKILKGLPKLKQKKLKIKIKSKTPKVTINKNLQIVPIKKTYVYLPKNEFNVQLVAPYKLYPYQVDTVNWLISIEEKRIRSMYYKGVQAGGILAMVMGLGKTLCSSMLIARTIMEQRRVQSCSLIICPKNLLGTIRYELEKFYGDSLNVIIYHENFLKKKYNQFRTKDIQSYDVVITNYETLTYRMIYAGKIKHKLKIRCDPIRVKASQEFCNFPWFRVILDESHEIRTKNTMRFRAVNTLQSPRKIAMTGTPIHNTIKDLYHQLEYTGLVMPFGHKYTTENLQVLNLYDFIMFVPLEAMKSIKLPSKTVNLIYFTLSDQERFLHNYYFKTAKDKYSNINRYVGVGRRNKHIEIQVAIVRVQQLCSAPYLITPQSKINRADNMMAIEPIKELPDLETDRWVKNKEGAAGLLSSKMIRFVHLVKEIMFNDTSKKIVVFANSSATLQLATESLVKHYPKFENRYVFVHSKIPSKKREGMYTQFRINPIVNILFMTLKLGSQGLNLTESHNVIFMEPWYAYAALSQGEGRVHRIGQKENVNIYYLLAKDSIEERMYGVAMDKKELYKNVVACHDNHKLAQSDMAKILQMELC